MTALDQFTHEIFVNGGADVAHAMPTIAKHAAMLPIIPVANVAKNALSVANDTAVQVLTESLKDAILTMGPAFFWVRGMAPFAILPIVTVVVVVVQISIRKVKVH
jgi:hypothetical protein